MSMAVVPYEESELVSSLTGATIVEEGADGSLLVDSPGGSRRRVWMRQDDRDAEITRLKDKICADSFEAMKVVDKSEVEIAKYRAENGELYHENNRLKAENEALAAQVRLRPDDVENLVATIKRMGKALAESKADVAELVAALRQLQNTTTHPINYSAIQIIDSHVEADRLLAKHEGK